MDSTKLNKVTAELKEKYPDVGIQKIEVDEKNGRSTFFVNPTEKVLATLPPEKAVNLHSAAEVASTLRRDVIDRSVLDLIKKSVSEEDPHEIFKRSIKYYYEGDYYGSHIDILTNFSSKGFENDIDDDSIKAFYDTWNFDVNFKQVIDWIFFDLFRVGMVRTYKIIGKYEPGVSYLSPIPGAKKAKGDLKAMTERAARIHQKRLQKLEDKLSTLDGRKKADRDVYQELSAKKKVWSKGFMPIAYTVLNPLLVEIDGSLLFDKTKVTLKPSDELKKLLKKPVAELTEDEKLIIKLLPSDFKAGVEEGGGVVLDPLFVGSIDYRKQPYERYPKPRGVKVFDSLEYKNSLREADLSTLDGISNYILKITVGTDAFPATDQAQLEAVAQLFNTTSKSFDVVWNHTLEVEKIVSPEIEAVLGQDKYAQVNEDISGGLAFSRALVDGITDVQQAEAGLIVKTVIEEVNYAREQVERWIYNEYRQIAEAMGFDRFPKVRWDNTVLRDIILYMSTISQLVDRRMLSYETALEQLGFDYANEFNNMENELPSVLDGVLGILGSPFQQSKTQPTQNAPTGTPSNGRPKGQVPKKKQPSTNTKTKTKVPNQSPSNQPSTGSQGTDINIKTLITSAADIMDEEQFKSFLEGFLGELKNANSE
jgi:hypothetical protein